LNERDDKEDNDNDNEVVGEREVNVEIEPEPILEADNRIKLLRLGFTYACVWPRVPEKGTSKKSISIYSMYWIF
jgi:hypothetical protein